MSTPARKPARPKAEGRLKQTQRKDRGRVRHGPAEMSAREARLAETQYLFRQANARLERAIADKVPADQPIPFICECSDDLCMASVALTLSAYSEVRDHPDRFVIVSGHPTIPGERVVQNGGEYWIVEKGHDE